jgi:hypothetical protein
MQMSCSLVRPNVKACSLFLSPQTEQNIWVLESEKHFYVVEQTENLVDEKKCYCGRALQVREDIFWNDMFAKFNRVLKNVLIVNHDRACSHCFWVGGVQFIPKKKFLFKKISKDAEGQKIAENYFASKKRDFFVFEFLENTHIRDVENFKLKKEQNNIEVTIQGHLDEY